MSELNDYYFNEEYGKPVIYETNENITSQVLKGLSIPIDEIFKL